MHRQAPISRGKKLAKSKLYRSLYRMQNKEEINAKLKDYRDRNPKLMKESHRKTYFKINYGITPREAELLLDKQGNICVICKESISLGGRTGAKVDHCHITNKIRGILCSKCNIGIGHFQENITILFNAINYLRDFKNRGERREIGVAG